MFKKWLLRALVGASVSVAALLVATPALAMWDWCDVDPTLNIGGHTVALQASIQGDPQQICGHIQFTVTVPWGTKVTVVSVEKDAKVDIRYSGFGNSSSSDIPVTVNVDINMKHRGNCDSKLTVSVDGKSPTLLDESNTRYDLEGSFTVK